MLIGRELLGNGLAGRQAHYSGPLHLIMFGPNGVGKGMRVLVPNLLSITGKSVVVIDPKGQLAAMTAKHRHQAGNDVKIVDPFGVVSDIIENDPRNRYHYLREHNLHESVGFNPLSNLDPLSKTFYDDTAVISEAMIKIADKDPHWSESAQGLLTGLIMWECMTEGKHRANLGNVRRLLTEAERLDKNDIPIAGLRYTALKMVMHGGFAVESLAARFMAANDEIASVRSTADTQTRWLLSEPMRADLLKDGIDFGALKSSERPTTVYVVLPAEYLETHSIWLRLVVSEALRACLTPGGRPVLMMIDEFAALGYLSIVQRLFGVTRDYKIQMWPVFQDLNQLQRLYPQGWETLLGMAGVVQSFRVGDLTTAEWLSKRSGQMEVPQTSTSTTENYSGGEWHKSKSTSVSPVARPTIYPHDLFGLDDGVTITFWAGEKRPLMVYTPHLVQVPRLEAQTLPNPYHEEPYA